MLAKISTPLITTGELTVQKALASVPDPVFLRAPKRKP